MRHGQGVSEPLAPLLIQRGQGLLEIRFVFWAKTFGFIEQLNFRRQIRIYPQR